MDLERRSLRIGAAVIACAVILRLMGSSLLGSVAQALEQPEVTSFLLYLETGRVVRPQETLPPAETPAPSASSEPSEPAPAGETRPAQIKTPAVFTAADAELVSVSYYCDYRPDLTSLLLAPLDWDLTAEGPTVLILHTHTTESYTKTAGQSYEETSDYRTLDENYNMLSIGDRVAEILEGGGIAVLHDRTLHDYPSYNGSYNNARATIEEYLEQYPSIRLILDLHRDAAEDGNGNQVATSATVNGQNAAQLMMVVGTDGGGLTHPNWKENMALAVKLHAQLEKLYPGICRPISFRNQRFNQDESPGAMLIEVGAAGNTQQQALTAAEALAQGILALAYGATADSTS